MPSTFAGQGSLITPTSGAGRRVAITGVANTSPIQITASGHGFYQTDTVVIEGTGISALDGNMFQVNIITSSVFSLLGTTAAGTSSAGYAIDYELLPAVVLPTGSDLVDPNTASAAWQGCINPTPFLYQRTGKWRLHQEYTILAGDTIIAPFHSNPWSNQSGITTTLQYFAFNSAQFSLQNLQNPTTQPAPYFGSNEWVEINMSFTVGALLSGSGGLGSHVFVGAGLGIGTGIPSLLGGPIVGFSVNTTNTVLNPVTVQYGFPTSFDSSNVYLTLVYWIDYLPSGSIALELVGPLNGHIHQYRAN
jgi:hypothetical protein